MPLLTTAGHKRGTGCPVCGGDCKSFPDTPYPRSYPFLPGGFDPMPEGTIPAPGRIEINNVLAFAEGDPVPADQAVRLHAEGNWPGAAPPGAKKPAAKKAAQRARKAPTEDRAVHGPREDRSK